MYKLIWLTAAAALSFGAAGSEQEVKREIAPARNGDVAIHEEFCAARKAGTVEAYDLFIARHPRHRLAKIAKEERAKLSF